MILWIGREKNLTKDDYLLICGDFGAIFSYRGLNKNERKLLEYYKNLPCHVCFIDGNHECFPRLNAYPKEEWNGGKIHRINENLVHLCRGQVFDLDGFTIFTMGGARSHDRGPLYNDYTSIDRYWWEEEMPCQEEMEEGRRNLSLHNHKVDFIVTHSLPTRIMMTHMNSEIFQPDEITDYLQEIIMNNSYRHLFSGHYHLDRKLDDHHTIVYNNIIPLTAKDFPWAEH